MSISFQCPSCQSKLRAKPRLAGKRSKCPKCGEEVEVPGQTSTPPSPGTPKPEGEEPPAVPAEPASSPPPKVLGQPPTPTQFYVFRWGVAPTEEDVQMMLNVWLDLWQPAFTVDDIQPVTVEAKDTYAYPTFSEFAKGCIDVVRQQLPQAELDDRLAFGAVQDLVLVVVWDGPPAQQVRPFLDRARAIEDISAVPSLASRKRIDTTRRDDLYRDLYRSVNEEIRQDKSLSFGQVMIAMKIGANLRDGELVPLATAPNFVSAGHGGAS